MTEEELKEYMVRIAESLKKYDIVLKFPWEPEEE